MPTTSTVQMMSEGMPARLPAPKIAVNGPRVTGIDLRSLICSEIPEKIAIVASVTRKEGSRRTTTNAPFTAPITTPAAIPAATATGQE